MISLGLRISFYLLIFASFNVYAVNKTNAPTHPTIKKLLKSSKVKISNREVRIARTLIDALEDSIENEKALSNRTMKSLYSSMKSTAIFKEFAFWPKEVIQINKANRLTLNSKKCDGINPRSLRPKTIYDQLKLNLKIYCLNNFYKKLTTNKYSNKTLSTYLSYFEKNLKYSLKPGNKALFYSLISSFKMPTRMYKKYVEAIESYYMKSNRLPPKGILKNIPVSGEFTRYIQTHTQSFYSQKSVFTNELRKMSLSAIKEIDDFSPSDDEVELRAFEVINYYKLTKDKASDHRAKKILTRYAKSLLRRQYTELSQRVYKSLIAELTAPDPELVFNLFWTYLTQHKYQEGIDKVVTQYLPNQDLRRNHTKLNFWYAYSLKKLGNADQANKTFQEVIQNDPLSYYAIISSKQLETKENLPSNKVYLSLINNYDGENFDYSSLNFEELTHLKRIILWSKIAKTDFLNFDLHEISKKYSDEKKSTMILASASVLSKDQNYLDSFKVIYKSINNRSLQVDKSVLGILFPKPYYKNVKRKTKHFDPFITLSLIRQESGFNRKATSRVGARGLMQLMPATAKQFKRRLKQRHLYSPNLNIKIGTKYLNNLINRYDGNLVYSLAAYNAGESRVDRWQTKYLTDKSILHNIENIPFLETKKYVKLIFRNIFFYKLLENNKMNDSKSPNQIYDVNLGFKL